MSFCDQRSKCKFPRNSKMWISCTASSILTEYLKCYSDLVPRVSKAKCCCCVNCIYIVKSNFSSGLEWGHEAVLLSQKSFLQNETMFPRRCKALFWLITGLLWFHFLAPDGSGVLCPNRLVATSLMEFSLTIFLVNEAFTKFGNNQMSCFLFIGLNLERRFWGKYDWEHSSSCIMDSK